MTTLQRALGTPGLKIGRTDPKLDPKGAYTIEGMTMWLGSAGARRILGDDENPSQIFPEENLLARVDTGQVDVGFFYQTEAIARNYHFIPLPGAGRADRSHHLCARSHESGPASGRRAHLCRVHSHRRGTKDPRNRRSYLSAENPLDCGYPDCMAIESAIPRRTDDRRQLRATGGCIPRLGASRR